MEEVYAIWMWDTLLYEFGEADGGYYCRCVDSESDETVLLGLGETPSEAFSEALREALRAL
jgi:hypothetical protein